MAFEKRAIENILGGHSPTLYFKGEGQFLSSLGIDPDIALPVGGSIGSRRQSGVIAPVGYSEATDTSDKIDSAPMWIITDPKTAGISHYYLASGRLASYPAALDESTYPCRPVAQTDRER